MSTLKTHNLQSPDAGSVNIALAPNAGMVVAGLSTYSNQINVGSNIKIGNAGVVTATSFSGDGSNLAGLVSVANQANNRLITATSTTDALYGESTLTYDGTNFEQSTAGKFQIGNDNLPVAQSQIFHIKNSNVSSQYIRNETSSSNHSFLGFSLKAPNNDFQIWNQGSGGSGYGGTNSTNFYQSGSSFGPYGFYFGTTQALRINTNGNIVMGNSTTSTTRLDIRFTDTTTYSASTNHPNGLKIFNDCATDNGFAGIEIAATDGDDYYGSTLLKSIATGVNYSNDFAITTRHSGTYAERFRIKSDGRFGLGTSSPSDYALATFDSNNGIQLQGNTQTRILMRDSGGGTDQKMMDIMCDAGNIFFRTIADNYTTATQRAVFRADGNFAVGYRVGTSSVSTNQPVAFHSARVTPDGMTSTVSNGVRCNLYVGSNSGWQSGDGGVIGMGGSRSGSAGQEAIWSYIKGSRQSGNGWEYAGKMELGTTEWGTYNMTKAMTIFADNQVRLHGDDNSMMTFDVGGALRLIIEHTGGGNMRLRNLSSGTVTYSTSSDHRLKENATTINNALTTIKSLKPYQFTWKHDNKLGQGFFAHEAQAVLPDIGVVSGTKDEVHLEDDTKHDGQWKKDDPIYQSVDYSKLVPLLTAALQEETAKREALEARVAALEGS